MALKIKNGKKYWIKSISEYGTIVKIVPYGDGTDIVQLRLEDGDLFNTHKLDLAKSQPVA